MLKNFIIICFALFSFNCYSNEKVILNNEILDELIKNEEIILNDEILKELIKNNNPTIENINTIYQQDVINELSFKDNYNYKMYGNVDYFKTTDNWTTFDNSGTNNETNFDIGVEKNTMYGISGKISINDTNGNYYISSSGNRNTNRSAISLTYSMDLWKNFLGYTTLSKNLNIQTNKKQSFIKTYIEKNKFYYSLRSIYWKIVIKNKELNFYEDMIKQAEKNLSNVRKRYKTHIADAGDLSKAKANVNLRKTQYKNIEIQIEDLKKSLMYNLPELMSRNFVINTMDLTDTFSHIMSCNRNIYKSSYEYKQLSSYSDYVQLMDKSIDTELKTLERESDFDVKLNMSASFRGTDKDFDSSYNDLGNFDRNDYYVGLNITKNLGDNSNDLKAEKIKLAKMNYNYNKKSTLANMNSFYNSYESIMKNMFNSLNNLHSYKKNIENSLNNSRKKYNQGRLSLNDLITDEDSLVDANIQLIDMEGVIIDTILQYLSIFDKTDCFFNIKIDK